MTEKNQEISLTLIDDPHQPMRSELDQETILELAASIKLYGLLQPITVRPVGDRFEVVAGHRRLTACRYLGLEKIQTIVREMNDDVCFEIMAAENLERLDVDPVDEALFVGRLINMPNSTVETIAKRLNRSAGWVEDRLNILEYPDYLVAAIKDGKIKLGVAKWLGRIEDDTYRKMFVDSAIKNGMSVMQSEYAYNQWKIGLMPTLEQIEAAGAELDNTAPPPPRAVCAKCGNLAVSPNLRMVWVHIDCPKEPGPSSS